jgi:hypothetical protein
VQGWGILLKQNEIEKYQKEREKKTYMCIKEESGQKKGIRGKTCAEREIRSGRKGKEKIHVQIGGIRPGRRKKYDRHVQKREMRLGRKGKYKRHVQRGGILPRRKGKDKGEKIKDTCKKGNVTRKKG